MRSVFKYVVVQVGDVEVPVLFPAHITHKGMAQALAMLIAKEGRKQAQPVSAGFVSIKADSVFDRSESLDLSPRAEDELLINSQYQYAHSFRLA